MGKILNCYRGRFPHALDLPKIWGRLSFIHEYSIFAPEYLRMSSTQGWVPPPDHDSTILLLWSPCLACVAVVEIAIAIAATTKWRNEEANEMTLWRIARSFCRRQSECALHKARWKFEDSLSVLTQGELSFVTHCGVSGSVSYNLRSISFESLRTRIHCKWFICSCLGRRCSIEWRRKQSHHKEVASGSVSYNSRSVSFESVRSRIHWRLFIFNIFQCFDN